MWLDLKIADIFMSSVTDIKVSLLTILYILGDYYFARQICTLET